MPPGRQFRSKERRQREHCSKAAPETAARVSTAAASAAENVVSAVLTILLPSALRGGGAKPENLGITAEHRHISFSPPPRSADETKQLTAYEHWDKLRVAMPKFL